jgi:hypothetical protein
LGGGGRLSLSEEALSAVGSRIAYVIDSILL